MIEVWMDVIGYEGIYKVSNLGNIVSLEREIVRSDGIKTIVNKKEIIPMKNSDGYLSFKLCKDNRYKTVKVHRVVAEAFLENNVGKDAEVNHIDMNRSNNISTNLEWCSHIDNIRHSSSKGRYIRLGEKNSNYGGTKLKEFYKNNPEELKKLVRKGSQNGRSKKIKLLDINKNEINRFGCISECALYIVNERLLDLSYQTLIGRIGNCAKNATIFKDKYYFEYI